jgi:hypothetical protein
MSKVMMNTKEQKKDSGELTPENFADVKSQETVNKPISRSVYLVTLSNKEWLIYIQDPESYRKRFECGQA